MNLLKAVLDRGFVGQRKELAVKSLRVRRASHADQQNVANGHIICFTISGRSEKQCAEQRTPHVQSVFLQPLKFFLMVGLCICYGYEPRDIK
jgi:hypothetical protein